MGDTKGATNSRIPPSPESFSTTDVWTAVGHMEDRELQTIDHVNHPINGVGGVVLSRRLLSVV